MKDKVSKNSTYLGVEESLAGKRWVRKAIDERVSLMLSQRLGLSETLAQLLAARGIGVEDANDFLYPKIRHFLPDPSSLCDMDRAADRVAKAIMTEEKIGIFGDYDVDGATSSALLKRFFNAVNGNSLVYIPDRIKEGYGPNGPALLRLKEKGMSVVITVDCGSMAIEPIKIGNDAGLDIIVVDHHAVDACLPPAFAIVNPNRFDDISHQGELAAVGVVFLLVVAINRALRLAGWYQATSEPNLSQWLDIVALGTICDVVPLKGLNRAFVSQGLKVMGNRKNLGLKVLADIAKLNEPPSAFQLGYVLGPRINAGGRVGAAGLGSQLLSTDDTLHANDIALRLDKFNAERKIIEESVFRSALTQLQTTYKNSSVVFAVGEEWHLGVIGIVASRLKELFNRPALVVSLDRKGGFGIGSGRSISGIDLGANIIAAQQLGLLEKGGGHKMAAGFAVSYDKLNEFYEFMEGRINKGIGSSGFSSEIFVEGSVGPGGVTSSLISEIYKMAPFGSGNPEPMFVIPNANISYADVVGDSHIRVGLSKPGGGQVRCIAFRSLERAYGKVLLKNSGEPFHFAGKLRMNNWQGRNYPQFQIEDVAPAYKV